MTVAVQTIEQQRFGYSDRAHYLSTKEQSTMDTQYDGFDTFGNDGASIMDTIDEAGADVPAGKDFPSIPLAGMPAVVSDVAEQADTLYAEYADTLTADETEHYCASEIDSTVCMTCGADMTDSVEADEQAPALVDLIGVEELLRSGRYVALYTTNGLGDLPATIVLDTHIADYNGKTVRKLACPAENASVQRASSRIGSEGQQYICVPEHIWLELADEQVPPRKAVAPAPMPESTPAPEPEPETPAVPAAIAAEVAAVEKLSAEEQELADELAALQARLQAKALERKAAQDAIPVVIDGAMQEQIDHILALATSADPVQALAKAIKAANLYYRLPGSKAKKDTGIVRKVTQHADSSGIVAIHHNGSAATCVSNNAKTLSPETIKENEAIQAALQAMADVLGCAWYEVKNMDTSIAKKLAISNGDSKLGSKRVWNLRNNAAKAVQGS